MIGKCKRCRSSNLSTKNRVFSNGTHHVELFCVDCGAFQQFIKSVNNEDFIMPFGKYKGEMLGEIPTDYLMWMIENIMDKPNITEKVAEVLYGRLHSNS